MKYARGRTWQGSAPKGVMNKTEAKFAERLLSLKLSGQVVAYHFEALRICIVPALPGKRLAVHYTPDFLVLRADLELELIDVKGSRGWEEDARLKIKTASERFPEFHWVGYTLTKAGVWEREEFN